MKHPNQEIVKLPCHLDVCIKRYAKTVFTQQQGSIDFFLVAHFVDLKNILITK